MVVSPSWRLTHAVATTSVLESSYGRSVTLSPTRGAGHPSKRALPSPHIAGPVATITLVGEALPWQSPGWTGCSSPDGRSRHKCSRHTMTLDVVALVFAPRLRGAECG